jgi:hypothetical protein
MAALPSPYPSARSQWRNRRYGAPSHIIEVNAAQIRIEKAPSAEINVMEENLLWL